MLSIRGVLPILRKVCYILRSDWYRARNFLLNRICPVLLSSFFVGRATEAETDLVARFAHEWVDVKTEFIITIHPNIWKPRCYHVKFKTQVPFSGRYLSPQRHLQLTLRTLILFFRLQVSMGLLSILCNAGRNVEVIVESGLAFELKVPYSRQIFHLPRVE